MAKMILSDSPPAQARPLSLLSVVIPARDEASCVGSTVEHLHLELRLQNIPHELIVVDDGSTDGTWKLLADLQARLPELAPGSAIAHGFTLTARDTAEVRVEIRRPTSFSVRTVSVHK